MKPVVQMSDSFSRKQIFAFLIKVIDDLHFFMFSGNWFQIFGPMYLIDCLDTVCLHDMGIFWKLLPVIPLNIFV